MTTPQRFEFQPWFWQDTPATFEEYASPSPIQKKQYGMTTNLFIFLALFLIYNNRPLLALAAVAFGLSTSESYVAGRPQQARRGIIPSERERQDGRDKGDKNTLTS